MISPNKKRPLLRGPYLWRYYYEKAGCTTSHLLYRITTITISQPTWPSAPLNRVKTPVIVAIPSITLK